MINEDLSLFLLPIKENQASGENIRYDAIYRQVQELRSALNSSSNPEYRAVEQMCINILQHTSKDLHIAAVLAEVWAHLYDLQGLTLGLELIMQLCEKFWDTLHPYNPDNMEARLSTFIWINDKLSDVLLKTSITNPKIAGGTSYTLASLVDARQLELTLQKAGSRRSEIMEQAIQENRPTLEAISKSMLTTPLSFYEDLLQNINFAVLTIDTLEEFLEEKFKEDAVTLKNFDAYLVQIETYAEEALVQKKAHINKEPLEEKEDLAEDVYSFDYEQLKHITSEQLYELLEKLAQRLEELDPKSPSHKLLRKAIEWRNMSTTDFVHELARNNINPSELSKLLI